MSDVVNANDNNFDKEVLQEELPVLVDFSATWCGPCKRQLSIMEKFAQDNNGKVKVVKVDIDDSPDTASQFGIRSVPSIVLFNKGKVVESRIGVTPTPGLQELLNKI